MMTQRKSEMAAERAYQKAVRILAARAHSRQEMAHKLRQRGYAQPTIAQVLQRCVERGYIDDAATSDGYCRELIRKGFGPRAVRQRLFGRGISDELIQRSMETHYPPEAVRRTAMAVADRKSRQLEGRFDDEREVRMRLARFLDQRGFTADIIHAALNGRLRDDAH